MTRRSGLGKGLSSLIPQARAGGRRAGAAPVFVELPIGDVVAEPAPAAGALRRGDAGRAGGVDRPDRRAAAGPRAAASDGRYQLIAGERRWRAAQRAGLATVPAVVRTTDDVSAVEQALVENLHREDLTPLEEAAAYQQLIEDFELTHDDVAQRVGKSRSAVTNTLRLLGLPPGGAAPARRRQAVGRPRPGPARHARPGAAGAAGPPGGRARAGRCARSRRRCASGVAPAARRRRRRRRPREPAPIDGAGLTRGDPAASARPARVGAAAGRPPRHPGRRADGRQAGQGDDRVRRPRGPRADLPAHRRRAGERPRR